MMRTLLMLVLLVSARPVFAQEPTPTDRWMRAGYISLAAVSFADIDTTARAMERGLTEANPLYKPFAGTPAALGLVNGAVSGGVGLVAYKLHKSGKRKEARLIVWTWTAIKAVVVTHNLRELRKAKR